MDKYIEKRAVAAVLRHIASLGGGVDGHLVQGLADDLAGEMESASAQKPLTTKQRRRAAELVATAGGLLGESLAAEIRRELAETRDALVADRLRVALAYFETQEGRS